MSEITGRAPRWQKGGPYIATAAGAAFTCYIRDD